MFSCKTCNSRNYSKIFTFFHLFKRHGSLPKRRQQQPGAQHTLHRWQDSTTWAIIAASWQSLLPGASVSICSHVFNSGTPIWDRSVLTNILTSRLNTCLELTNTKAIINLVKDEQSEIQTVIYYQCLFANKRLITGSCPISPVSRYYLTFLQHTRCYLVTTVADFLQSCLCDKNTFLCSS